MAKKQTFGDKALQSKMGLRKMAKVIVSTKNAKGKFGYKETIIDVDNVKEFLATNN